MMIVICVTCFLPVRIQRVACVMSSDGAPSVHPTTHHAGQWVIPRTRQTRSALILRYQIR